MIHDLETYEVISQNLLDHPLRTLWFHLVHVLSSIPYKDLLSHGTHHFDCQGLSFTPSSRAEVYTFFKSQVLSRPICFRHLIWFSYARASMTCGLFYLYLYDIHLLF